MKHREPYKRGACYFITFAPCVGDYRRRIATDRQGGRLIPVDGQTLQFRVKIAVLCLGVIEFFGTLKKGKMGVQLTDFLEFLKRGNWLSIDPRNY